MRIVCIEFIIESSKDLEFFLEILRGYRGSREELSDEEIKELEEIAKACEEGKMKTYSIEEAKKAIRSYVCPICGKRFKSGVALGGHLRWCKFKQKRENSDDDFDLKKMFLEEKKVMEGILK